MPCSCYSDASWSHLSTSQGPQVRKQHEATQHHAAVVCEKIGSACPKQLTVPQFYQRGGTAYVLHKGIVNLS